MKLYIINNSSDSFSYVGGNLVVSANSQLEIPRNRIKDIIFDAAFIKDIELNNIFLSNGQKIFKTIQESKQYLLELTRPMVQIVGSDGQNYTNVDSSGRILSASELKVNSLDVSTTNRLPVTDILNIGILTGEKTSTSVASIVRAGSSNLVGRKIIEIVNTGTVVIYVGGSTVSTTGATRGRPIDPKGVYSISLATSVDLYVISASNTTYVVTEAG